jgi:hypothetical protein
MHNWYVGNEDLMLAKVSSASREGVDGWFVEELSSHR